MSLAARSSRVVVALALGLAGCQRTASKSTTNPGHDSREAAGGHDSLASEPLPTVGSDDVEVSAASDLAHVAALGNGSAIVRGPSGDATLRYIESVRTSSGVPEVHDEWTDVTVVQSGRATLVTGGQVVGTRATSPGEHRGGTIHGGEARVVSSGDSFIIPAGVPHQYQVAPGDSIRYLTIKVARQHAAPR